MRRIILVSFVVGLSASTVLAVPPQGCEVEMLSSYRLSLPVPGSAGIKDLALVVDEQGTMYVSFSSWQTGGDGQRARTFPQLASYDPNGKLLRIFERPPVPPDGAQWARITSLAYAGGRVYASAQWHEGRWQSALLIFETSGDFRRLVSLEGLGNPRLVQLGSNIGVTGRMWTEKGEEVSVLWTFSAGGERESERVLSEALEPQAHPLSDEAGRLLLVTARGEIETLDPKRTWAKVPGGIERLYAAFTGDGAIIVNRVDPKTRRTSLVFLNERGEHCERDTTGRLTPMVRGADGFFYGFGQLALRPDAPSDRREILVGKFRITWRENAR